MQTTATISEEAREQFYASARLWMETASSVQGKTGWAYSKPVMKKKLQLVSEAYQKLGDGDGLEETVAWLRASWSAYVQYNNHAAGVKALIDVNVTHMRTIYKTVMS